MGEKQRKAAAAAAKLKGITHEQALRMSREEIFQLIAEAGNTVLDRDQIRGPHILPQGGDFDVASVEIARRGAPLSAAAEAADMVARMIGENPRLLISLMLGGYEDDPRELLDIPEALTYFAAYGGRLQVLDEAATPRGSRAMLLFAHDELSQMLMLVGLGIIPREKVKLNVRAWDDPVNAQNLAADIERAKARGERHMADETAAAKGATKQ